MNVVNFTFNPFQENTYLLYDETKACIIIDPGCYTESEQDRLEQYISENELNPVRLINTHCHLDHICGNEFVEKKYNLKLEAHELEKQVLASAPMQAALFNFPFEASPEIVFFLHEGDEVTFGHSSLAVLFTPGHSPGEICLYSKEHNVLIAGDVLFFQSIGRTDLPGGDHATLIKSIREKLLLLPDETIVYPGHGPKTNIGFERRHNPFLR